MSGEEEIERLREENERLRELLNKCIPYIQPDAALPFSNSVRLQLIDKIKKEVSDE